jgi:hypothetical protein
MPDAFTTSAVRTCTSRPSLSWRGAASAELLEFGLAMRDDFDQAFRLIHDQYVWRGYMNPHASGRRLSLYNALPSTRVFVAKDWHRVVGTATLIEDSPLGLPIDELYEEELAPLREQGRRIAELSAFAIAHDYRPAGVGITIRLGRLLVLYAAQVQSLDDLWITVNPRHVEFYRGLFPQARRVGRVKRYQKVNGAPAVALHLDLNLLRALILAVQGGRRGLGGALHDFFFGADDVDQIVVRLTLGCPQSKLSPEQVARFFAGHEALTTASPEQLSVVQACYADLDLEALCRPDRESCLAPPAETSLSPALAAG